jgi:deoxyribonuclease V
MCGQDKILPILSRCVYNRSVKIARQYDWRVSTARAREIQLELATQIIRQGKADSLRYIAGADIAVNRFAKTGTAAVVVLSYPEMKVVETRSITAKIEFPYVPGLLTFREAPLVLAAFEKLTLTPDLVLVDGQGIAHPRRIGLASHLGLCLGLPTIGCAKSRLIGEHGEPGIKAGSYAELVDNAEVIGVALRTKTAVKPLYVSIGHLIDLPVAIRCVLECCRGFRLPEPTRLAHIAAGSAGHRSVRGV